jgi:cellulose synthase/poly-beta-1,6-N-acetylglucosamine synthase-like glycosyltransferase
MKAVLTVIFLLSAGGLLHTYLFYPFLLLLLSKRNRPLRPRFGPADEWPQVSVLLSVYNEEKVIWQKLESLFQSVYPAPKLNFFIGSDASSDTTNAIVEEMAAGRQHLHFLPFAQRRGKPSVLNDLAAEAFRLAPPSPSHLLLITDANVFLEPDTIQKLASHFKDANIGLVDAHMINTGLKSEGISTSETQYIRAESLIKYREGQIWGAMIGPFGGCYMLRSDLFEPIPPHFLVDDFYLAMKAFEKGARAMNDLDARCFEAVSHEIQEEYRRKSRIAAGNFQNMMTFRSLWFPPFRPLSFAFFSHKILRWLGPFAIILMLVSSLGLFLMGNLLSGWVFLFLIVITLGLPLLDKALGLMGYHGFWLRGLRYFMAMNLALLAGFFRWMKGVRSGAWEPPKRV